MTVTVKTRKPVQLLTSIDFDAFPIWEYAIDEEGTESQDETWVRPVDLSVVPDRTYTHVAAEFSTANGRQLRGFVTVSTLDGKPEVRQGVIFHLRKGLFVSNPEAFGFLHSRTELLRALGLEESEVFPLAFRLLVPVAGEAEQVTGVLP